jgi:proliferating cell nuclear antigen
MEMKIEAKHLKEVVSLLMTLVSEAKIEVREDGWSIKAVDPAHIAMIVLDISSDAFLDYQVEKAEDVGVDLEKIKDILKLASATDVIAISKDGPVLKFRIGNVERSMTLIDPSAMTVPKVPSISLPARVTVSAKDFENGIRAAEDLSDHIVLEMSPDGFAMSTKGNGETARLFISREELKDLECDEPVRSIYPVEYLYKLVKAMRSAENIVVHLGTDYPLQLEFPVVDGRGKGIFLLAPRVEG